MIRARQSLPLEAEEIGFGMFGNAWWTCGTRASAIDVMNRAEVMNEAVMMGAALHAMKQAPSRALFAEPNQDGSYPYEAMKYTVRELGADGEWIVIARGLTREEAESLP